jgi:hypothetical protein
VAKESYCSQRQSKSKTVKKEHFCELLIPKVNYVVLKCYEANGNFWMKSNLFGERVNYCPICGQKAPNQIKDEHDRND